MTHISKTLVFFGTEDFSARSLEALLEANFPIALVVTKPDTKRGRGQALASPRVKIIAQNHGIPVLQPDKLSDIIPDIKKLDQPAGVLVSFGKIIPSSVIELFSPGIINLHPSLLPRYRGPSPIETAILHGDRETGVSIMRISAQMDAGPVYIAAKCLLTGNESQETVSASLAELGNQLLVSKLPDILDGSLQATPQDESKATYCQLIKKSDGRIDWNKPADIIEREIRAYHAWPKSHATLGDLEVIIRQATVTPDSELLPGSIEVSDLPDEQAALAVGTGKGNIKIEKIQPVGKKEMPVQAFLIGYRSHLQN